jgi:hypothetical protein
MHCYQAQAKVHSNMNRLLSSSEGSWMIPALIVVCQNTHKTALAADKDNVNAKQQNAKLQNAVQLLQDSYSKTFNDRTEYQVSTVAWQYYCSSVIHSYRMMTMMMIHVTNPVFSRVLRLIHKGPKRQESCPLSTNSLPCTFD